MHFPSDRWRWRRHDRRIPANRHLAIQSHFSKSTMVHGQSLWPIFWKIGVPKRSFGIFNDIRSCKNIIWTRFWKIVSMRTLENRKRRGNMIDASRFRGVYSPSISAIYWKKTALWRLVLFWYTVSGWNLERSFL